MSKPVTVDLKSDSASLLTGTLKLGGHDVSRCISALRLYGSVNGGNGTRFELYGLVLDGFDVTLPAEVTVNLEICEPGIVECHDEGEAGKRWVFKRVEP
jgi:hypothetical protein